MKAFAGIARNAVLGVEQAQCRCGNNSLLDGQLGEDAGSFEVGVGVDTVTEWPGQ